MAWLSNSKTEFFGEQLNAQGVQSVCSTFKTVCKVQLLRFAQKFANVCLSGGGRAFDSEPKQTLGKTKRFLYEDSRLEPCVCRRFSSRKRTEL